MSKYAYPQPEEYNGVLNTDGEHTDDYAFCTDGSCECHEDKAEIYNLYDQFQDGLVTDEERDRYYWGGTI